MNQTPSINKTKATEAIAMILQLHQKPMILSRLLKILYFIDRLSLAQNNRSLTNDNYLCKKSGLIPQQTPDLVLQLQLLEILSTANLGLGYIKLNRAAQTKTLSASEQEMIRQVYHQKKHLNPFNLLEWQYDLWFIRNHLKQKRSSFLTPVDIMVGLGKTKAEIKAYLNNCPPTKSTSQNPTKIPNVALAPN
ncbi:MAG: type II toxin-antitoxin system antitoxin SocA domain-containing protein [Cyanobacteria bacterium P01_A01_bin.83]